MQALCEDAELARTEKDHPGNSHCARLCVTTVALFARVCLVVRVRAFQYTVPSVCLSVYVGFRVWGYICPIPLIAVALCLSAQIRTSHRADTQ